MPGHVVATTLLRWWPGDEVFRSTDGGASWKPVLRNATRSPGNSPWSAKPKPHWMTDIDIDPFDSDHAIFNTGFGLFRTTNLTAEPPALTWTFFNDGLEETVPHGLISPPEGPPLVSVIADYCGFRHDRLDTSPARGTHEPSSGSTSVLSSAGMVPARMIRQNRKSTHFSLDTGISWKAFPATPPTVSNGHNRAVFAADGRAILWCPTQSAPYLSNDGGATWSERNLPHDLPKPAGGNEVPATWFPCADRVDARLLYLWDGRSRQLLVSTDGGTSFERSAARDLPGFHEIRAVPGMRGHLWASAGNNGFYRSTDSGASFTKIATPRAVHRFDFGKPARGSQHPTVFIWGAIGETVGFFRSDDSGTNWVRINDDKHQFGYINAIAGDPRVFGRVFLGTSGRGVVVGQPRSRN